MSFLLWTDEATDKAIDLGDPFTLYGCFAEMVRVAGSDSGWEELFSVPGFGEQHVEEAWLAKTREQAKRFLSQFGDKLGEDAKEILKELSAADGTAPDDGKSDTDV